MQALSQSVPLILHWATADPHLHWSLLDTLMQVWLSLLWGHCSFLLGLGVHKFFVFPSKIVFPQSCVSSNLSGLQSQIPWGSQSLYHILRLRNLLWVLELFLTM